MKKLIYPVLILSLLSCCRPKQEKVEKYMEHGKEVIINHIDPYKIKAEPTTFTKVWFPKYWAPYDSFFPDDEGRLFVKTYEEGDNPGEYIYDIFNPDGIFIGRKSLNIYSWRGIEVYAKAKRNRFYCLEEKESGYRELAVYKMKWEW